MYFILRYMWGIDIYWESIKDLVDYVFKNLEVMNFLFFFCFFNLLMNDVIFFLDEVI